MRAIVVAVILRSSEHHAAATSSLSAPRMTIFNASSGSGRCSAFASSHGASLGIVATPLHDPSTLESKRSFSPLNRNGEIKDVVRAVNYLEDADYVTAEISYVDGGRTAGH